MVEVIYWVGWAVVLTGGVALALAAVTWLVTAPFYWSFKRLRALCLFLRARRRQRKLSGKRVFLQARNMYDDEKPPPGAIVFQLDRAGTTSDVQLTLNIQGDSWETKLMFRRDDGAMWIVP